MIREPKTRFTLEVMETTIPFWSMIELWLCTEVSLRPIPDIFQTHGSMI